MIRLRFSSLAASAVFVSLRAFSACLTVFDVQNDTVPPRDISFGVEPRLLPKRAPTILAVRTPQPAHNFSGRLRGHDVMPFRCEMRRVIGVKDTVKSNPGDFLEWCPMKSRKCCLAKSGMPSEVADHTIAGMRSIMGSVCRPSLPSARASRSTFIAHDHPSSIQLAYT